MALWRDSWVYLTMNSIQLQPPPTIPSPHPPTHRTHQPWLLVTAASITFVGHTGGLS